MAEVHTSNLADSLETIIASARIVREYEGRMVRLSDRIKLQENTGLTWNEISLAQLTAQGITETTTLNNPQSIADTLFSVTPTMVGVQTIITHRTMRRISSKTAAKIGVLAQNAIQRKKDQDGLSALAAASSGLGSAGNAATSGLIAAAAQNIRGNTTEPAMGVIYGVLHPFQIVDFQEELVVGVAVGTAIEITSGETAQAYREGWNGRIHGVEIFDDGNITIDANDDAIGGVFAKEGLVLVDGFGPTTKTQELIRYGGGADELIIYDEYAWGERSSGNWVYSITSDATAPA